MSYSLGIHLLALLSPAVWGQATSPPVTTTTARPWFFQTIYNTGANIFRNKINAMQSLLNGGLRAVNTTVAMGTGLVTSATSGLTSAGRGFVNTLAGIKSGALQTGANITRQGLGMVGSLAAPIPLLGPMVQVGVGVGQAGVDMMNRLGQAGISTVQYIKNAKLNAIDSVVQGGAGAVQTITNLKVGLAQGIINGTANAINSALGSATTTAPTTPTTTTRSPAANSTAPATAG